MKRSNYYNNTSSTPLWVYLLALVILFFIYCATTEPKKEIISQESTSITARVMDCDIDREYSMWRRYGKKVYCTTFEYDGHVWETEDRYTYEYCKDYIGQTITASIVDIKYDDGSMETKIIIE